MSEAYLEVTYRQGKPFAAYLYLPRKQGARAIRTERRGRFLIDFSDEGRPIGIEFTSVRNVDPGTVNTLLTSLCEAPLPASDLAPLNAA
jgi:hypothetical protein